MIVVPAEIFDKLSPKSLVEDVSPAFDSTVGIISKLKKMDEHQLKTWLKNNAEYVGAGSSREAYVLMDMTCLKIALNASGCAQNRQEYINTFKENDRNHYKCFSEIYDADTENWKFLHVEMAKEAKRKDFEELLSLNGAIEATAIPTAMIMFDNDFSKIDPSTLYNLCFTLGDYQYDEDMLKSFILSPRFMEISYRILKGKIKTASERNIAYIYDFFKDHGLKQMIPGDICADDNWGVVWRNKVKQLIIIDSGFSEDIYYKYYH